MRFANWEYPDIVDMIPNKYGWMVQHSKNLKLGMDTDIGAFTYINARYNVVIEAEVQIGSHCSIYSASTIDKKAGCVTLKKGCCIGTHSTVMPDVTVGENAVVGAHSFVNQDIPANETWAGVPARNLKKSW